MSPFGLPAAGYPASARWHVFMYAGFKRIAPDQDTCAVPRYGTADALYVSTHREQ